MKNKQKKRSGIYFSVVSFVVGLIGCILLVFIKNETGEVCCQIDSQRLIFLLNEDKEYKESTTIEYDSESFFYSLTLNNVNQTQIDEESENAFSYFSLMNSLDITLRVINLINELSDSLDSYSFYFEECQTSFSLTINKQVNYDVSDIYSLTYQIDLTTHKVLNYSHLYIDSSLNQIKETYQLLN